MKAIILARVSTDEQMQEGYSIPAQLQRAREYCQRKNLEMQSEHQFDESSSTDQRKKFNMVVDEIKRAKEAVALVVETVDRLQRSFRESVLLDELRKEGRLEIHFIRENLIIHKDSNSSEIQRWDLAVFVAKSYVLQLSDNVKRSFEQKRRSGEWIGKAPIGYINIKDEKGNKDIIPDPQNAHFIISIFELYATGNHSFKIVRDKMTKAGLRSSVGKALALSMIEHILKNPFYYGEMRSKEKLYPHKYKPIISKPIFDRCDQVRKNWGKKPFQYAAKPYMFRGLLRCVNCGCAMSPETAKGKFVYYSCTNAKKDLCNKKIYVAEKTLLEPIYEILKAFESMPQEKIDEVVVGLRQSHEVRGIYHNDAIAALLYFPP